MHYHPNLEGITFKLSIEICFYPTTLSKEIGYCLIYELEKPRPCIMGTGMICVYDIMNAESNKETKFQSL